MKRFLSILICFVLTIGLFPIQAYAEKRQFDTYYIGAYHYDDPSDELYNRFTYALQWVVLKVESGKALLVCTEVLDVQPFDNTGKSSWKDSSIRYWLNHDFYDFAFTDEEKAIILTASVKNGETEKNSSSRSGSNDTEDKIFLLSEAEYKRYIGNDFRNKFPYTDYAKALADKTFRSTGSWWLRSPGKKDGDVCSVDGTIGSTNSKNINGVCPAMWIDYTANTFNFRYQRFLRAVEAHEKGQYDKAAQIFSALGYYCYGHLWSAESRYRYAISSDSKEYEEIIQRTEDLFYYCDEYDLPLEEAITEETDPYVALNQAYYQVALKSQAEGKYDRAIDLFKRLGNYEDSMDHLLQCYDATNINYAYINATRVNAGTKDYNEKTAVDKDDPHHGWRLGRFIIVGFTQESDNDVFLRTFDNDITLLFDIDQDINALNGNSKMSIAFDKSNYDGPFDYELAGGTFGKGALLIQHENYKHDIIPVAPYTDFLEASSSGVANTRVEINEEGRYDIALDYLIKASGLGGKTNGYRLSFSFDIRNDDSVIFLRDVKTMSELQNYSVTTSGFKTDFKSHSVKVHVTRKNINLNGTALDDRISKPAYDGESFTDKGYYTIEMTNSETGKSVTKHVFVGNKADLHEFVQIEPALGPFVKLEG